MPGDVSLRKSGACPFQSAASGKAGRRSAAASCLGQPVPAPGPVFGTGNWFFHFDSPVCRGAIVIASGECELVGYRLLPGGGTAAGIALAIQADLR